MRGCVPGAGIHQGAGLWNGITQWSKKQNQKPRIATDTVAVRSRKTRAVEDKAAKAGRASELGHDAAAASDGNDHPTANHARCRDIHAIHTHPQLTPQPQTQVITPESIHRGHTHLTQLIIQSTVTSSLQHPSAT